MNLFIEYYKSENIERDKEIYFCINKNINNIFINRIYLFVEKKYEDYAKNSFNLNSKIVIIISAERVNIDEVIQYINNISNDESINIISNSDIFFNHTLSKVKKNISPNTCFALSRWEIKVNKLRFKIISLAEGYSQDSWMFKGKINLKNKFQYYLGTLGVDNAFAYIIQTSGYEIYNISKSIRAFHYHSSNIRNTPKIKVKPPYLFLHKININQIKGLRKLNKIYESDDFFSTFLKKTNEKQILYSKIYDYILQNMSGISFLFLDIGAGYGLILEKLSLNFQNSNFYFIEQSQYLYSLFKNKIDTNEIKNINLENNLAENINLPFSDFILLSHILYYSNSPIKILKDAILKLNSNGCLLIIHPNWERLRLIKDIKVEKYIYDIIISFLETYDYLYKTEVVDSIISINCIRNRSPEGKLLLSFLLQKDEINDIDFDIFLAKNTNDTMIMSDYYIWVHKNSL